jgi:outer membrane protein
MRFTLWSTLILLFLFVPPATATAPPAGELFAQGRQHLAAGQFTEAYDLFRQAFLQEPGNPDYNFHLGRAAFEKGDYESAIMAYDRVLIAEPDSPRVKLELARCHLQLGSRELAKQYFNEVLATNPPEAVWQNIQKFLEAIDASERRHFLNGILTFGVQHDDNSRVAPKERFYDFHLWPGYVLPLDMGEPKSDWIYTTTAVVNHVYKAIDTPWAWKTTVINYNAFYDTGDDLDIAFLGLTTGPVRQTDKYLWELQALVNYVELDYDRYLGVHGLGTTLTLPFDQKIFFIMGATVQEKNFYQSGEKDAINLRLHGGPVFTVDKNRLGVTVARETENADSDVKSYDRFSLALRYDRLLPYDFALFAGIRFEGTKYAEADPLFGMRRSDDVQEFTMGLSRTMWRSKDQRRNVAAQISYAYTDAESNISLYEYDKNVVATSLTLAF